jgi:hypothetical protein
MNYLICTYAKKSWSTISKGSKMGNYSGGSTEKHSTLFASDEFQNNYTLSVARTKDNTYLIGSIS